MRHYFITGTTTIYYIYRYREIIIIQIGLNFNTTCCIHSMWILQVKKSLNNTKLTFLHYIIYPHMYYVHTTSSCDSSTSTVSHNILSFKLSHTINVQYNILKIYTLILFIDLYCSITV